MCYISVVIIQYIISAYSKTVLPCNTLIAENIYLTIESRMKYLCYPITKLFL